MTREQYRKLKIGDKCLVNRGNDTGREVLVDFIKGDQVVVEPVDGKHFKSTACKDSREGSLRVIIWWQLDPIEKIES